MLPTSVGQTALVEGLGLRVPMPAVASQVGPGARRTYEADGRITEQYPEGYRPEETWVGHLKFALKYEPLDLGVLAATFAAIDRRALEAWVRTEPTGAYARRAWFLYEWLTGTTLDVDKASGGAYQDALNPKRHIVARGIPSPRHKVTNNLLGVPGFCPTVRRTPRLAGFQAESIDAEARAQLDGCDPSVLARAINFLYTKETQSSFLIERETPSATRAERFVAALRATRTFDPTSEPALVTLQNTIVDARYAARGFRDFQNFVGEVDSSYREVVHFVCPRPQDLHSLMASWAEMTRRLKRTTDPVVAATLVAFGFVFLHPFEDGNGRIHRYLIHHVLAEEGFTPRDVLFPVSAAIVRDRRGYDSALETFSARIHPHIDWRWTATKEIEVHNDTAGLYRYFDATALVEFLYAKVAETVRVDLRQELAFVARYDAVMAIVREHLDMPDRRASLLVRCLLQNQGSLSKKKREDFAELTDAEVAALETAVQSALATLDAG